MVGIMNKPYVKLIRNESNFYELIKRRPTAFVLLALIAYRARRTTDNNFDDLKPGDALIGDFEAYGVTERVYRTDKKLLEKFNFITTKSTNRGTVANIADTSIFDINVVHTDGLGDDQATTKRRPSDDQATTNKNGKNGKNGKNNTLETKVSKERNNQISEIIKNFEPLNPSFNVLYARSPQRKAVNEMIEQYGYAELLRMVKTLPKLSKDRFFPTITTPYQLREKMGNVMQYIQKQKSPTNMRGGVWDARTKD